MRKIYTLFFVALAVFISNALLSQIDTYTVEQSYLLTMQSEDDPNFVILDVRTAGEYNPQHLEGAINRDFYDENFEQMLLDLDMTKTYLIHCQSGGRSSLTYAMMQDMDFVSFYDMLGGIADWNDANYPTTEDFAPDFLSYTDTLVSFGDVLLDESDTFEITITNGDNSTLEFISSSSLDGTMFSSDFDDATTLAGAENYSFEISFLPTIEGPSDVIFSIESNGGTINYSLSGQGISLIGVDENSLESLQFYPNPVCNELSIKCDYLGDVKWVEVFSEDGKTVLRKTSLESNILDVSDLENGNYIIQICIKDAVISRSLVVMH